LSTGENSIKATISENKLGKLFDLLQSPYSNPIGSIVRETSTNAWDAHVEAEVTEPIVIYFGVDASEGFYIEFRDFGIGMDQDRIHNVYVNYLESTKENTNDQSGYFGIGSKSPLSYSDDYYVITRVDGIQYEYMIRKDTDGVPVITLIDQLDTPDGNGTTVKLYIKSSTDVYNFAKECLSQLKYFEHVYYVNECGLPLGLSNNFKIIKGDSFLLRLKPSSTVDMYEEYDSNADLDLCIGQVRYPLNKEIIIETFHESKQENVRKVIKNLSGFALRVPIGSVPITITRENIKYNDQSKAILRSVLIKAYKEIVDKNKIGFEVDFDGLLNNALTQATTLGFRNFGKFFSDESIRYNFSLSHDMVPVFKYFARKPKPTYNGKPIAFHDLKNLVYAELKNLLKIKAFHESGTLKITNTTLIQSEIYSNILDFTQTYSISIDNVIYRVVHQDVKKGNLSIYRTTHYAKASGYKNLIFIETVEPPEFSNNLTILLHKMIEHFANNFILSEKQKIQLDLYGVLKNNCHKQVYNLKDIHFSDDDSFIEAIALYPTGLNQNAIKEYFKKITNNPINTKVRFSVSDLIKFNNRYPIIGFRKSQQNEEGIIKQLQSISFDFLPIQLDEKNEEIFNNNGLPTVSSILNNSVLPTVNHLKKLNHYFNHIVLREDFLSENYLFDFSNNERTCLQTLQIEPNLYYLFCQIQEARYPTPMIPFLTNLKEYACIKYHKLGTSLMPYLKLSSVKAIAYFAYKFGKKDIPISSVINSKKTIILTLKEKENGI